jgi:UPF0716 family protein affecting phage T7 exclusion
MEPKGTNTQNWTFKLIKCDLMGLFVSNFLMIVLLVPFKHILLNNDLMDNNHFQYKKKWWKYEYFWSTMEWQNLEIKRKKKRKKADREKEKKEERKTDNGCGRQK